MNDFAGKCGLIVGVANKRSISWAIAQAAAAGGARLALTYPSERLEENVRELAAKLDNPLVLPCDVTDIKTVDNTFAEIKKAWGGLDFVVHALAFSDRRELAGRYADTTRENFSNTMVISCFSFTEVAKRASEMMKPGGSLLTLTFSGATRWVPCYNVMGVAKAALEASVRYLAADLGVLGIRVNALSAGPMRTLAGAGISDGRMLFNYQRDHSPLRRSPTLDEVGGAGLYLLSDLSGAVTGEVHFVDCGYNTIAVPNLDALHAMEQALALSGASPPKAAE